MTRAAAGNSAGRTAFESKLESLTQDLAAFRCEFSGVLAAAANGPAVSPARAAVMPTPAPNVVEVAGADSQLEELGVIACILGLRVAPDPAVEAARG